MPVEPREPQPLLSRDGLVAWVPRLLMTSAQTLRRLWWFFTRPETVGVRALCLTSAGKAVLVRHSYMPGWFLPGGARTRGEDPEGAILRELTEEIGLTGWSSIEAVCDIDHRPDYRRDRETIFLLRDVVYAPRLSLEIERIQEFSTGRLPSKLGLGMADRWMRAIAAQAACDTA